MPVTAGAAMVPKTRRRVASAMLPDRIVRGVLRPSASASPCLPNLALPSSFPSLTFVVARAIHACTSAGSRAGFRCLHYVCTCDGCSTMRACLIWVFA